MSRPGQEQMPMDLNAQRRESGSLLAGSHSLPSCQGSNDCDLDGGGRGVGGRDHISDRRRETNGRN